VRNARWVTPSIKQVMADSRRDASRWRCTSARGDTSSDNFSGASSVIDRRPLVVLGAACLPQRKCPPSIAASTFRAVLAGGGGDQTKVRETPPKSG